MIARRFVFFFALCLSVLPLYSQSNVSRGSRNIVPPAHKGPVTSVFISGNEVVSAGEDGFIEIWDISGLIARERFQLSSLEIKSMVKRPGKDELCLLESDGLGLYRISAWNYRERKKIFSLRFRDPVTYINYSAFPRAQIGRAILREADGLLSELSEHGFSGILERYKARSCTLGQRITVTEGGRKNTGVAVGFDELGFLLLRTDEGETLRLSSGNVTLRNR